MSISPLDYAYLDQDAYSNEPRHPGGSVRINGHEYSVLAVANCASGYHAVAYQDADSGDVVIAERGTVLKPLRQFGVTEKDVQVDLQMVKDGANAQWPYADAFVKRAIAVAKSTEPWFGHPIDITVSGHSLGGTLAEITAYKYGLHGVTFNAYGAADLDYGVPRGGDQVIDYVVGSDVVSAASHHYGRVIGYARQQDIQNLKDGRYLDPPDIAHPTDPLLTGSLDAHSLDNFAPMKPGDPPSILTVANHERYVQHQAQFGRFRGEVLARSGDLREVLSHNPAPVYAEHLSATVDDAASVAVYHEAVRAGEYEAGVPAVTALLDMEAQGDRQVGGIAQGVADAYASTVRPLSGQLAQELHATGQRAHEWFDDAADRVHAASQSIEHTARYLASAQAHDAVVDAWTRGERAISQGAHRVEQVVKTGIDEAGQAVAKATNATADTLVYAYEDMRHPDRMLYQSAREAVYVMEAERGVAPGQHSERLAAALSVAARHDGLQRIDKVALTDDGSKAWAVEGDPHGWLSQRTHVDTARAVQTPVEQSNAAMPAARQYADQQMQMPPQQQQMQRQARQAAKQQSGPVLQR